MRLQQRESGSFTIHQVTDTHIPVSGDLSVRDNFLRLMAFTQEEKPDLLVITGDLPGEDGNREAYDWIYANLPDNIPCLVIPGNHDDPKALFEVFGGGCNTNPEFVEKIALAEIDLLFVNTGSNRLPDDQLDLLSGADLRAGSVLFIHHPTKKVADGFMDINYPLENYEDVDVALSASNIAHVFCGHFHTDYSTSDDYDLHITPSPAFEVGLYSAEFQLTPPRTPLREIAVSGSDVTTRVIYLDDN